ncbi:MAG: hypothetical protein NC250_06520 [Alistipes senegalensis]|nr:hypothetical protein [Bacteroides cellulosilyticus]MCM1352368.1 hypothetical protein [Alistipes senegalensis]
MKRLLLSLTIALVFSTSCDKEDDTDMEWDFACFSARFYVLNSKTGEDLLDPDVERNILDRPIAVVYKDVRYEIEKAQDSEFFPPVGTRFLMPKPLALRLFRTRTYQIVDGKRVKFDGPYCLAFGEFTPVNNWHGEEFTIEWGDGSSNTVNFDLYIKWKHKNDPHVFSPLRLDGVPHDGWHIALYK